MEFIASKCIFSIKNLNLNHQVIISDDYIFSLSQSINGTRCKFIPYKRNNVTYFRAKKKTRTHKNNIVGGRKYIFARLYID